MNKTKKALIAVAVVLALGLAGITGGFFWYRSTHVSVGGVVYEKDAQLVDLRGQQTSVELYEELRQALPQATVRWDVPFRDGSYPDDTEKITVTELTMEDAQILARYLPRLKVVDAPECRNYGELRALEELRPDCQVNYYIHAGSQKLEKTAQALTMTGEEASRDALQVALSELSQLKTVELHDPAIPAQELQDLAESFPDVAITWDKKFGDQVYPMDQTQLDVSGQKFESLEQVEQLAAYFPGLERLVMDKCGFENEAMAEFRDRVRDRYKVVWGVQIGEAYLMTDETKFMPGQANTRVRNDDMYNLRYCEDMIAVDVGHLNISNLEWVVGTPHLKYLIVGDANVFDENLKPISCLKELEWLELFNTPVKDVSPLIGCTGLRDVLLSKSYIDVEPLGQMPWLENIWLLQSGINGADIAYLHEKLPNTHLEVSADAEPHSHGWRNLPRYFDMRDALGMWYMSG